jgi:hypothetical protein
VRKPAIQIPLLACIRIDIETELGCDHDLLADGGKSLAHELLVRERAAHSAISKNVTPRWKADLISAIPACLSAAGP